MKDVKQNIKYLHIIRGFAALFVVLTHAKWPFWIGGTAYFSDHNFKNTTVLEKAGVLLALLTSNGTAMVIVFFVLSGFIISYSYTKNNWSYKNFLINRAIRIYVPYLASMILAAVIVFFSVTWARDFFAVGTDDYNQGVYVSYTHGFTFSNLLKTLLFYRSDVNYIGFNYVYWSLLYEMIFYLFFPFILKNIKPVFWCSLIIYPLHLLIALDDMQFFYLFFPLKFLFYFASGVMLYKTMNNRPAPVVPRIFRAKYVSIIALLVIYLLGIVLLGFKAPKSVSFFFAVIFAVIWIWHLLFFGASKNIFTSTFLFLGKVSYSLYLVHVPLLLFFYFLMYRFGHVTYYDSPWIHFIFVLLTIPFSYIFYKIFEEFSIRLIDNHKRKVKTAKVTERIPDPLQVMNV